LVLLKLTPW